jgi:hypothetical protein
VNWIYPPLSRYPGFPGLLLAFTRTVDAEIILLVTVNPEESVAVCPSGFVTTTSHTPVAAPARLNVQVILVEETAFTLVAAMVVVPIFSWTTVVPETLKFVPARLVILTEVPVTPLLGVMPDRVGALRANDATMVWLVTTFENVYVDMVPFDTPSIRTLAIWYPLALLIVKVWLWPYGTLTAPAGEMVPPVPETDEVIVCAVLAANDAVIVWFATTPVNG